MTVTRDTVTPTRDTLVHSYLFLRRAVGVLGLALPAVLIIGKALLQGGPLLGSISDYAYSDMRGVLVGTMAAIGVFLFSYRGYGWIDDITADVAAVGAIGIALFPTTPFTGTPSKAAEAVGLVHVISAVIFFAALIVFCLFLFTRTDSPRPGSRKRARNVVYIVCGVIMLVCLIAIGVIEWVFHVDGVVLWLESAAVMAFGVAWLIKGETILTDRSA
jgi:heme A synthase